MKKILSLAVLILLIWNQPSFAESNWFKQQEQPADKKQQPPSSGFPEPNNSLPKGVAPGGRAPALLLKQPCDKADKMFDTIKKYEELMLFTGEGLTFGLQNQVYNGGMFFFVNQDTRSWTMLQVYADGMACMIFNGKNFEPYMGTQPDYGENK